MDKESRQLKLLKDEGEVEDLPIGRQGKNGKKEKEQKGNKWIVFFILVLTLAATLFFYFSGGGKLEVESPNLGAPKVYQF